MREHFSDIAHPFSDGLKMYYGGVATMIWEQDSPYPTFKPTLHVKPHHSEYSDEEIKYYIGSIMMLFTEVLRLLKKLYNVDVNDEINDYSELHASWSKSYQKKKM